MYIYVLQLSQGKWYVGKTTKTVMKRFAEHKAGYGCAWTRKYKPIEIVECFLGDNFDEDKKTKQYMNKYGIDNVRGGSYCKIQLEQASVASIKREMDGANDKCNKCGKLGHFMRDCKYKKSKKCTRCNREGHTASKCYATTYIESDEEEEEEEDEEIWVCGNCDRPFATKKGAEYHLRFHCRKKNKKSSKCKRCGRNSHYTSNCYAETHADGYYLSD